MKNSYSVNKSLLLVIGIFFLSLAELFAQSGIYVGGHFRRERPRTINELKASGFTYVILFNITVQPNGDLTTDGETIVTNGTYVFGNTQPYYVNDVNSLKTGITGINRVEYCIGGWGNHSYDEIRNLINAQGTGTGSILYRNFKALKDAIPSVDAINNDDEGTYDVNTATAFHVMLKDIGFKTTIAPYMNYNFWNSLVTNINNQRPGTVDRIDLQVYDGGAGNNPCDWHMGNIPLYAGQLHFGGPTAAGNNMTNWKNNCNVKGGFIWVYNAFDINLKSFATRINDVFGVRNKDMQEVANFFADCDYKLFSNGLEVGDYTMSQLQAKGIPIDGISSLTVKEGFEVELFNGANFDGGSIVITGNKSCLVADGWNDRAASIKIRTKGVTNLSGYFYIQNRKSGLLIDVAGGTTATQDGANVNQWHGNKKDNQKWELVHLGNGTYRLNVAHSGKSLDISEISKNEGANVQQWTYFNTPNQQFIVYPVGDGYFKLIAKHSGHIVEVKDASMEAAANIRQWGNNNQTCGMWKFIPADLVTGTGDGLTGSYFNGINFETPVHSRKDVIIDFNWNNGSPHASVNADKYSIRWTGQIEPQYTGIHTFYINSDNGRRLWVNNQLIIDKWVNDWGTEYSGSINLTKGQKYDIKLEYFEDFGGASCKLEWSSQLLPKELIPTSQLYSNPTPVVSITDPENNSNYKAPATILIKATATDNNSIAKVDFYNSSTLLGSDNSAPFEYTWNNISTGSYNIKAIATDNQGAFTISTSIVTTVNENQSPEVSITSPLNNTTFEAPASITFEANANDNDGNITQVEFFIGVTSLGIDNTEPYSFTWNDVTEGSYTITAKATDDNGAVSTSNEIILTVNPANQAPTVSIISPLDNAAFEAPASISIEANASDTDGNINKVEFFNGGTSLGIVNGSPYIFEWTNVAAGTYTITAVATDDDGATTTSTAISVTINNPNQMPEVSITSPANNTTFDAPASIIITANATDADGHISKVEFYNGPELLGEDETAPYTFIWENVMEGNYSIFAIAFDNIGAAKNANAIDIEVLDQVTGIGEGSEVIYNLVIAPNPVKDELNLISEFSLSDGYIKIFNSLGIEVFSINGNITSIDVSGLPEGTYTLVYTDANTQITKQFIK